MQVSFIFRDINLFGCRMKQAQSVSGAERRVRDWLHFAVRHSRAVGNPRQTLDLEIKNLIGPNMEPLLLGVQRALQNFRLFHWRWAYLSFQYDAIGHATGPEPRCCGSSETHTGSMGHWPFYKGTWQCLISGNIFQNENLELFQWLLCIGKMLVDGE